MTALESMVNRPVGIALVPAMRDMAQHMRGEGVSARMVESVGDPGDRVTLSAECVHDTGDQTVTFPGAGVTRTLRRPATSITVAYGRAGRPGGPGRAARTTILPEPFGLSRSSRTPRYPGLHQESDRFPRHHHPAGDLHRI